MKEYKFNNLVYKVEKGDDSLLSNEELDELVTDYFKDYDYIFIDEAYNKLRLKGYYDKKNKKVKPLNNIENLDDYIENYCAFGSKWVLLKKNKEKN